MIFQIPPLSLNMNNPNQFIFVFHGTLLLPFLLMHVFSAFYHMSIAKIAFIRKKSYLYYKNIFPSLQCQHCFLYKITFPFFVSHTNHNEVGEWKNNRKPRQLCLSGWPASATRHWGNLSMSNVASAGGFCNWKNSTIKTRNCNLTRMYALVFEYNSWRPFWNLHTTLKITKSINKIQV